MGEPELPVAGLAVARFLASSNFMEELESSPRLAAWLCSRECAFQLASLVTVLPGDDVPEHEQQLRGRAAFLGAELIARGPLSERLCDAFFAGDCPGPLERLWEFPERATEAELDSPMPGYFARVAAALYQRRPVDVALRLQRRPGLIDDFLRRLHSDPLVELLMHMLRTKRTCDQAFFVGDLLRRLVQVLRDEQPHRERIDGARRLLEGLLEQMGSVSFGGDIVRQLCLPGTISALMDLALEQAGGAASSAAASVVTSAVVHLTHIAAQACPGQEQAASPPAPDLGGGQAQQPGCPGAGAAAEAEAAAVSGEGAGAEAPEERPRASDAGPTGAEAPQEEEAEDAEAAASPAPEPAAAEDGVGVDPARAGEEDTDDQAECEGAARAEAEEADQEGGEEESRRSHLAAPDPSELPKPRYFQAPASGSSSTTSHAEPFVQAVLAGVCPYLPGLGRLLWRLSVPRRELRLQHGAVPAAGARPRDLLRLVLALVQTQRPMVLHALSEADVLPACVDLLLAYPWNNMVHNAVLEIVDTVTKLAAQSGDCLYSDLVLRLLEQSEGDGVAAPRREPLARRIVREYEREGEHLGRGSAPTLERVGYMGHLHSICDALTVRCPREVHTHLLACEGWRQVVLPAMEARSRSYWEDLAAPIPASPTSRDGPLALEEQEGAVAGEGEEEAEEVPCPTPPPPCFPPRPPGLPEEEGADDEESRGDARPAPAEAVEGPAAGGPGRAAPAPPRPGLEASGLPPAPLSLPPRCRQQLWSDACAVAWPPWACAPAYMACPPEGFPDRFLPPPPPSLAAAPVAAASGSDGAAAASAEEPAAAAAAAADVAPGPGSHAEGGGAEAIRVPAWAVPDLSAVQDTESVSLALELRLQESRLEAGITEAPAEKECLSLGPTLLAGCPVERPEECAPRRPTLLVGGPADRPEAGCGLAARSAAAIGGC